MLLGELTQLSSRLAQTRKRSLKVSLIAEALSAAPEEERTLAVLYLTGELRQKKLGVGGAQLRALRDVTAAFVPRDDRVLRDRADQALHDPIAFRPAQLDRPQSLSAGKRVPVELRRRNECG